jgi:bacteriocin-like protein
MSCARVAAPQREGRWLEMDVDMTTMHNAEASFHELTEDDLALVSGGKPSAAKSSPAPKISESLSLSYEEVKFEYT